MVGDGQRKGSIYIKNVQQKLSILTIQTGKLQAIRSASVICDTKSSNMLCVIGVSKALERENGTEKNA